MRRERTSHVTALVFANHTEKNPVSLPLISTSVQNVASPILFTNSYFTHLKHVIFPRDRSKALERWEKYF